MAPEERSRALRARGAGEPDFMAEQVIEPDLGANHFNSAADKLCGHMGWIEFPNPAAIDVQLEKNRTRAQLADEMKWLVTGHGCRTFANVFHGGSSASSHACACHARPRQQPVTALRPVEHTQGLSERSG